MLAASSCKAKLVYSSQGTLFVLQKEGPVPSKAKSG